MDPLIIKGYSGNEIITLKTTSTAKEPICWELAMIKTAVYDVTDANGTLTLLLV
jgi:hypothetical protein